MTKEEYSKIKNQMMADGEFFTEPSGEFVNGVPVYESHGIQLVYGEDPSLKELVRKSLDRYADGDYGDFYDTNPDGVPKPTVLGIMPEAYGSYDTPFRSEKITHDGTDQWRDLDGAIMVHYEERWDRVTVYFQFER